MDLTKAEADKKENAEQTRTPRIGAATAVATFLLTLFAWPIETLAPQQGIDGSWQAAMHMAAHRGMPYGTEVMFTYGPFGFLTAPRLFFPWTAALAVLYAAAVTASLIAIIFWFTSRRVGYLWGSAIAFAVASVAFLESAELVPIVYFLACVACLSPGVPERRVRAVVFLGTFLGALQLLVKFNTGVVVFALAAALAGSLRRRRFETIAIHLLGSLACLVGLWMLARQPLSALIRWLRLSFELAAGYSSAMASETGFRRYEYLAAGIALLCLAVLVLVKRREEIPRDRRVLYILILIFVFSEWKHGFVRHDFHSIGFFLSIALIAVSLLWLNRPAKTTLAIAALLIVVVAVVLPVPQKQILLRPTKSFGQIATLASSSKRDRFIAESRKSLADHYQVDARALSLLINHTVHMDPHLALMAWIYDLDWRPVPIFQAYSAYTPELDRTDADTLASSSGPERILRSPPGAIDLRNPMFESPEYVLALLCNYYEMAQPVHFQVLGHTKHRCGSVRSLSAATDTSGLVPVPKSPDDIVFMRIQTKTSLLERIESFLYKPLHSPSLIFLMGGQPTRFRLVKATAGGSLVVCVPPSAGFNVSFVQPNCPDAIRLLPDLGWSISFYAVSIGRAGAPGPG